MNSNPRTPIRGRSSNAGDLRRVFVTRVHQLLEIGYQSVQSDYGADCSEIDEPSLTGFLKQSISQALNNPPAQIDEWCDHFFIVEDVLENTEDRTGKRRKKVDIAFECSRDRPRNHFRFEAKRLHSGEKNASTYLGDEGLGCFLDGSYGLQDPDAGMLGYVQRNTVDHWAADISALLSDEHEIYALTDGGSWNAHSFPNGPEHTYVTKHQRRTDHSEITVFHSLLDFSPVV